MATLALRTGAADLATNPSPTNSPYLEPKLLTGTIYDNADSRKVLFHFRRTATNAGNRVYVLREFTRPDGKPAARERVVYDGTNLISFKLEEFQIGAVSSAIIRTNPANAREKQIAFEHAQASTRKSNVEKLQANILIGDMIAPFITANWRTLSEGATVKLRLVALSRTETVGFKLRKESEAVWKEKPVVHIRMEPSSLIVARLLDPLIFVMDKEPPHRILQYTGRTTPSVLKNGRWEDLDGFTVFDWDQTPVSPSSGAGQNPSRD